MSKCPARPLLRPSPPAAATHSVEGADNAVVVIEVGPDHCGSLVGQQASFRFPAERSMMHIEMSPRALAILYDNPNILSADGSRVARDTRCQPLRCRRYGGGITTFIKFVASVSPL